MDKYDYEFVFIIHPLTLKNQLFLVRIPHCFWSQTGNVLTLTPSGEKLQLHRFIIRLHRGDVSTEIMLLCKMSVQSAVSGTSSMSILHQE